MLSKAERECDATVQRYHAKRADVSSNLRNAGEYNGMSFYNFFKVVGGSIFLQNVKFFGPVDEEAAEYRVIVVVEKAWFEELRNRKSSWDCCLLRPLRPNKYEMISKRYRVYARAEATLKAYKGRVWTVCFDAPVEVPPGVFMQIRFSFSGPRSGHLEHGKESERLDFETEEGKRTIEFLHGCKQMQGFVFNVRLPY